MRAWWVALVVACGGKQTPPPASDFPPMPEPAWAQQYEQRAADGCKCRDATCLDKVHRELARLEADHGGMDDAPPGVQQAHGSFDQCWRDGTKDPARDLELLAKTACDCTDSACLDRWKLAAMHLTDKYEVVDLDELAKSSAPGAASLAKARKCIADVTIDGTALVAIVEKATDDMCKCGNVGCAQGVMKARSDALGKYLQVDGLDAVQPKLDALQPKYCECLGDLVAREVAETLNPFPPATKIDVTMHCK
ncbi:MAG: hypothetical protein ACM31C_18570 [Acidobacteriota bacterium]